MKREDVAIIRRRWPKAYDKCAKRCRNKTSSNCFKNCIKKYKGKASEPPYVTNYEALLHPTKIPSKVVQSRRGETRSCEVTKDMAFNSMRGAHHIAVRARNMGDDYKPLADDLFQQERGLRGVLRDTSEGCKEMISFEVTKRKKRKKIKKVKRKKSKRKRRG